MRGSDGRGSSEGESHPGIVDVDFHEQMASTLSLDWVQMELARISVYG